MYLVHLLWSLRVMSHLLILLSSLHYGSAALPVSQLSPSSLTQKGLPGHDVTLMGRPAGSPAPDGGEGQDETTRKFLEEGTALDPGFKDKVADGVVEQTTGGADEQDQVLLLLMRKHELSAPVERFADEDTAVELGRSQESTPSPEEKVQGWYPALPSTPTSVSPLTRWCNVRDPPTPA